MSQYASVEYYMSTFHGKVINMNADRYLQEASEKIDSITYNRIVNIGFDNLTEFQKSKIMQAVCYEAEHIFESGYNDTHMADISSYSVGDISLNMRSETNTEKTQAEKKGMCEIAYDLVNKTGLNSYLL